MNFHEVSDAVLSAKGVDNGFLFQMEKLDEVRGPRMSGGNDFEWGRERKTLYRVVLYAGGGHVDGKRYVAGKMADLTGPDCMKTVRAAFEAVGVPLPEKLTQRRRGAEEKQETA